MTHLIRKILTLFLLLSIYPVLQAQNPVRARFDSTAWEIAAAKYEFTEYKGKKCLYLQQGSAELIDASFKNGIIDFDLSFEEARMFLGLHFRVEDGRNYEEFYLRSHQSGNPDAMQYTPVKNGLAGWQLYHGEGHSNTYAFNFGEWMHIRLIIDGNRMDVFINDMSQPILPVFDMKRSPVTGGLGFSAAMGAAYFANLSYQEMEHPPLQSESKELPEPEAGTILSWQVSQSFAEREIETAYELKDFESYKDLDWQTMSVEYTGLANLSGLALFSKETNTVLAKVQIHAEKAEIKRMDLGYSDIARVYINGKIMYGGQRVFRSRDYRYLGTIGYFDAVYLPLKKGDNEIIIAVSENFGGWGLKAKLENMEGIEIK